MGKSRTIPLAGTMHGIYNVGKRKLSKVTFDKDNWCVHVAILWGGISEQT